MHKQTTVYKTPFGKITLYGASAEQARRRAELFDLMHRWALHLLGQGQVWQGLRTLDQLLRQCPGHRHALLVRESAVRRLGMAERRPGPPGSPSNN